MNEWLETNLSASEKVILDITKKLIITVGREKNRDIVLSFSTISRRQCDIRRYKPPQSSTHIWVLFEGYFNNLNDRILPKNPTLVNGRTYLDFRKATLSDGDLITFSPNFEYPNIIFNNLNDRQIKTDEISSTPTLGQEF